MYQTAELIFSERPAYDANVVDAVFSKYCMAQAGKPQKMVINNVGIDVTKRKDAIRKSLSFSRIQPVQIFGELELDISKNYD